MNAYRAYVLTIYGKAALERYDHAVAQAGRLLAAAQADLAHDSGTLTEQAA